MARAPDAHWQLVHEATGATVAGRLHAAFDSATRRTGLLGQDRWPEGEALVIAPSQAVHTFGMRFAIDVLYVSRDGMVVKAKANVVPWRMTGAWRAFAVIELAGGALAARAPGLARGDRLVVRPA